MPRRRDVAARSVRIDLSAVSDIDARRLLSSYGALVRKTAARYHMQDVDELVALGHIGLMEAFLTYDPARGTELSWVRSQIRWRIQEGARGERRQLRFVGHDPDLVPTNGRHDPSRLVEIERLRWAIGQLSPRLQMIVDGRMRGETYEELGHSLGISTTRAHEQNQQAVDELRRILGA